MLVNYRAILLGATGAVGSAVLRELDASPRCSQIEVLIRRKPLRQELDNEPDARKVIRHLLDMENLEREAAETAKGCEAAFCTMGIGQPSKVSKEEFRKVDIDYTCAFARACRAAGVRHFSLLTAVGANAESRIYYSRVKGIVEERMQALKFERLSLFRPSLLVTKTVRYGWTDSLYQSVFPRISWAFPPHWHEITVEDLAKAMLLNAETTNVVGSEVLQYPEFVKLLQPAKPPLAMRATQ